MKTLLALALLSTRLLAPQAQGALTLDQVLAKVDQTSKTFKSIEADIKRTKMTILVKDEDVSSGKFYYMRRGKDPRVKMELTKPAADFLLIDNGKLQHYMPNVKQVQEKSISGAEGKQVDMMMALGFGQTSQDLKASFDVTLVGEETLDGKKTTVLDLKPKTGNMFKSVRMWLDQTNWISVQLKVTETSNDYMLMTFSNPKLNAGIPDSKFKLDLPKDVKVIKL